MIPQVISIGPRLTLSVATTERFKADTLSLSAVLPICRESAYLTSCLLSVLLRGCEKYPTIADINRRLDYLYGAELSVRNFYRGDVRIFGLSANLLGAAYLEKPTSAGLLPEILSLMAEIFYHPVLSDDGLLDAHYVESEKKLQIDAIRAAEKNPNAYAGDALRKMMYGNEPCATPIYGSVEEVNAITRESLTAHWKTLLEEFSFHVYYIGGAKADAVAEVLKTSLLPHLQSTDAPALPPIAVATKAPDAARTAEEFRPINQGRLRIGYCTGVTLADPEFYACTLLNELLGVSPISKLFINVREKQSLCYSCSSIYNLYKGIITVSIGLVAENRAKAEEEVYRQIFEIANGNISDEEWQAALKSVQNAYRQLSDHPGALENYYFGRSLVGVNTTVEEAAARFESVTREQVAALASRLSQPTVFFLHETGGEEENDDEE